MIDEAGLFAETRRPLWNALHSSMSTRNGRLIAISIQGHGPMFRELAERAHLDSVAWHAFQPDADCRIEDEAAWHAGNPDLATGIKSIDYMRDQAARAAHSPANEAAFRALDMNLPQAPERNMICSPQHWRECETSALPERRGPCFVGVELDESVSMSAVAAYWPDTGLREARGAFPTGHPEECRSPIPTGWLHVAAAITWAAPTA